MSPLTMCASLSARNATSEGWEPSTVTSQTRLRHPWNQVLLIPEFFRVGLQLSTKLDEVSIAVLRGAQPIEALGEVVGSHDSCSSQRRRARR